LNEPIWEAMVMVQVHVQWTHLEKGELAVVDFHLKNKLEEEQKMAQVPN
jgi:hypothetical protein